MLIHTCWKVNNETRKEAPSGRVMILIFIAVGPGQVDVHPVRDAWIEGGPTRWYHVACRSFHMPMSLFMMALKVVS